ncbi:hypothetical protein [Saccharibacillus endophyticus]|uniref:Uncharacterized protein n=1 Tax=Saccharibacillus endophyticus TaxID=2060666 RepID=A0ABQ1ZLR2_9BACL|nr:hypothetical protein [Saccharibacillus endophyticus]GGH68409.1 hypothetical protein GCM10007362_02390 [Saccharibacillus endophyticus]
MPYSYPVLHVEPYHERPEWLNSATEVEEYMRLSPLADEREVELFLYVLLGASDLELRPTPREMLQQFMALDEEDGIALSGGIVFCENENRRILPSCCAGVEQIPEIIEDVINRQSPWLGHDPWPTITYEGEQAYVWPDHVSAQFPDSESLKIEASDEPPIVYAYKELLQSVRRCASELEGFIDGPLYLWLIANSPELAGAVSERLKRLLLQE